MRPPLPPRSRKAHLRCLALAIAAVVGLTGCATSSRTVAQTTVITRTVTTSAPQKPRPRHRPLRAFSPIYTSYEGSYISVAYPDTWYVETAEAVKGSLYDTTIRSRSDPNVMVRVDLTPSDAAPLDASSAADPVEQALVSQPGYDELRFSPSTFKGYDGVDWVFRVRENGVLLQKRDVFFTDDAGDSVAILTQAPAGQYWRWRGAFAHVRASLAVIPPTPTYGSGSASSGSGSTSAETDFCSTHPCIENFYNGSGYIVQCNDGMWSHSGGLSGACSYHGGESGTTYP
jgi:hypothetical protein